jgi:hypothetical protein
MKTELQKKLLEKYPQFFAYLKNKKIYIGEKTEFEEVAKLLHQKEIVEPMQFGFECEDGWFMLLDELMGEIQNHIENENRNRKNEFNHKFLKKLSYWLRFKTSAKQKRLRALGEWIYKNAPKGKYSPISVHINQIKEKFSTLRFYYSGGDDYIDGMVTLAESLSAKICEDCGTTINIGCTSGWLTTLCESCALKTGVYDRWKKNLE